MPAGNGSFTQLPPNSTGPKLATGPTYTENGQTVQDEKVIFGEPYISTSRIMVTGIAVSTAAAHPLQIMAGATNKVQLRRLYIQQDALPAAATQLTFQILRLTTAGTGGTATTPRPNDPADTPGATAMTLPTVKGAESFILDQFLIAFTNAAPISSLHTREWQWMVGAKPLIIPAGIANGLAIKAVTAVALCTVTIVAEITETLY